MSKIYTQKAFKICIFFLLIVFVSCSNLTMPKKITIQADPEIQASFGKIETSLTDYFSVEKIQELIGENEDFKVYDYKYNDSDDSLRFLAQLDYKMEIDGLNVDESLQELENMKPISFGYEEDGITPSVLFSVPEINQTIEIDPISLEFNDEISDSIKDEFAAITFSAIEPGDIGLQNQKLPLLFELCDDEFDTITFGSGTTLDLSFIKLEDFTDGLTAKINSITLYDAAKLTDGKSIAQGAVVDQAKLNSISQNEAIVFKNTDIDIIAGTNLDVSIEMEGKTIPKDICIVLNVTFIGGTQGNYVTIQTSETKFKNMNITKVTGFTTVSPITVEFPELSPIDLSTEFQDIKGATIGSNHDDGKVYFKFNNIPSGVTSVPTLSFAQDSVTYNTNVYSGINVSNQTPSSNNEISLAGQNLNTNPIHLTGFLSITAENATIDFTKSIEVSAGIIINKFSEIHISDTLIPADILTQNYSYSLESIAEYVNEITFNEAGLALKLCNGLPFDATMKITSNFLGLNNKSETFYGNQTELPTEATKIVAGSTDAPLIKDIDNTTKFDLTINIDMPSSNGVISLQNITTGTDYKFFGQADLVIDWDSVNFKLPDDYSGFNGSFPTEDEDPLDLSAFTKILGKDITLSGIKPKLYISSDLLKDTGPLSGAEIRAIMKATYTKDELPVTEYLVGTTDNSEKVNIVDKPILNINENSLVKGTLPEASMELNGLEKVLTSGASDIKLEYDFKLCGSTEEVNLSDGITIKKDSLEGLEQSSEINISLLIDLPIIFTVKPNEKGYASLDIMALMNETSEDNEDSNQDPENDSESESTEEKDLFNRAQGEDIEGIDNIFEFIEKVSIDLQYQNNTGIELTLVIKDSNANGEELNKEVILGKNSGTMNLTFDSEDAQYIENTNPFYPDILEIRFPGDKTKDTLYNIKRDATVSVILQGSVKTNIDYTIDLSNPENTEGEN